MFAIRRYEPNARYFVVRDFMYAERVHKAGAAFPVADLKLHEQTIRELWKTNLIEVDRSVQAKEPEQPKAVNVQRKR